MWGTLVSDMQTGLQVSGHSITGTLANLTEGQLVTDWGAGHFMALKFVKNDPDVTSVKVGLTPSEGSGLVELDEDMNGVFKVTDKDAQRFTVQQSDSTDTSTVYYDLSGLILE